MRRAAMAVLLAASGLLGGCGLLPGPSALKDHQAHPVMLADDQRWWRPLGDPVIDVLVDELVAENLDLQIALARIDEARGLRRSSASAFLPDISLGGESQRGNRQTAERATITQGGFDARWELDLFGHTRAAVDAADAGIAQATADADDVRNSVIAELVRAVIEWRQAQETVRVATSLVAAQDDQISLIRSRTKAGLSDASELERALAQREQTAIQIPLARALTQSLQLQIERLLAKEPGSLKQLLQFFAEESFRLPTAHQAMALPIDAIRERPDLRAARAHLQGREAALRQAEREIWPHLTLGAFFGGQTSTPAALVGENPLWAVIASASMPLINFGRIEGAIDAADARAQQAALAYKQAGLIAVQETHTALSDFLQGLHATRTLEASLNHRQSAVALARERFSNGLTDMTDLTTAQSELDQANLALIDRKAQTALAYIRLHKALGTAAALPPDAKATPEDSPQ